MSKRNRKSSKAPVVIVLLVLFLISAIVIYIIAENPFDRSKNNSGNNSSSSYVYPDEDNGGGQSSSADEQAADETTSGSKNGDGQETETQAGGNADTEIENSGVYYYYNKLDSSDKEVYAAILNGMLDFENRIDVSGDSDHVIEIMDMLIDDHPELFWYDGQFSYSESFGKVSVMPAYNRSRSEAETLQGQLETVVDRIDACIENAVASSGEESDYVIAKAVFQYLVDNVEYVSDSPDNQNIISALINGESVCAGYSKAMQYILQGRGIQTVFAAGNVTGRGSHSWVAAQIDGKYYNIDATFGDREFSENGQDYTYPEDLRFNYDYLCISDEMLYRDRTSDQRMISLPECTSDDLDYYNLNGGYYTSYSDDVIADMDAGIQNGDAYFSAQFANESDYLSFKKDAQAGKYMDELVSITGATGSVTGMNIYNDDLYTIACWRQ